MTSDIPSQPLEDTSGIIRAYALIGLGFPMMFVPIFAVPTIGALMVLGGLVQSFTLRKKLAGTLVGYNHAKWIWRTVWISFAYFLIGFIVATSIVNANADPAAVEEMRQALMNGTATSSEVQSRMAEFHQKNAPLLFWTQILCFLPSLVVFVLRTIKGYRLAEKYQPVANVKTWLI